MENKFLVKYTKCLQVGPEDYEMTSIEKLFDETATIKDIKEWVNMGGREKKRMLEVKLSEPEQHQPS